jgi:hypothetical protein
MRTSSVGSMGSVGVAERKTVPAKQKVAWKDPPRSAPVACDRTAPNAQDPIIIVSVHLFFRECLARVPGIEYNLPAVCFSTKAGARPELGFLPFDFGAVYEIAAPLFMAFAFAFAASLAFSSWGLLQSDPLPSWNDGRAKQAIVEFLQTTNDKQSARFVPPAERIAAFDQDGTLWAEHPASI